MAKPLLGPALSTTGHTIFYDTNDNDDELWNISVNDRNTQDFDFDYQIYMTDARQFDEISDTSFQDIEDQAIDSQDEDVKPTPDCSGQPGLKTLDHQAATTVVSTTRVEYAPQRPNIDPLPEELDVVSTTRVEYAPKWPYFDPLPDELDVVSTTRVEYAPKWPYMDPLPEELDDMKEVSKWPMVGLGVFGVAAIGIMVWKKFLR